MRRVLSVVPLALVLGVAACNDTEDYEARIATLEQDLEAARTDADQRVAELTGRAEEGEAAQQMLATVEEQIAQALEQASVAMARLTELETAPGAEQLPAENLQDVRDNLTGVVQSLQTAATELGMETAAAPAEETAVEPAAGEEPMQEETADPAAGDQPTQEETAVEPAAGDEPTAQEAEAGAEPAEEEPVQQQ